MRLRLCSCSLCHEVEAHGMVARPCMVWHDVTCLTGISRRPPSFVVLASPATAPRSPILSSPCRSTSNPVSSRLAPLPTLTHPNQLLTHPFQAETTALEPVDFADVELAPLNKNNLRRLMHEDVLAYRPELRSPAAGSSLPEPASRTGGREAARDGGSRGSSSSAAQPPPPPHGANGGAVAPGESSHVSSRMANGGVSSSANTHAHGVGVGGGQRERSSRSDRDRDGRSSGGMSGTSGRSSSSSATAAARSAENGRTDARTHAAARVRSGGAVARHPFPTEG